MHVPVTKLKCGVCGHTWVPRILTIHQCPKCHRPASAAKITTIKAPEQDGKVDF